MKKNLVVSTLLFLCLTNMAMSQSAKIFNRLNNGSFSFKTFKTSTELADSNRITVSTTLIRVSLSSANKKKLIELKYNEWMKLLASDTTDWAANLSLYDIYKKDGTVFEAIKTKERWRKCCKADDILFWREKLRK